MHCDLRVRWKVASDLRFRAAISEPKTPSFCGIAGDLAPSTRRSLAIAIVRFWCAKLFVVPHRIKGEGVRPPPRGFPWKPPFACFGARLVSAMVRSLIAILYGMLSEISCLSCYPALFFCPKGGRSVGTTFRGPRHLVFLNVGYCVLGADPMVGRCLRLSVPWSLKTALRKEGRPMGPATPRVFDSSGRIVVSGR